ncbi:hypothetical protein KCU65_g5714, partial [Aureobasidium melanogenum]
MHAYQPPPVLAVIQNINTTPKDYESHELPTLSYRTAPTHPTVPFDETPIHPAFRGCSNGSANSTRNFSLPRERCLDVVPPTNGPVIPIPGPYVATGIVSRVTSTCRPLPPLPLKDDNAPVPPPHLEKVTDMTILPLRIHKRESASADTAVKRVCDDVDVEPTGGLSPQPGYFDKTPGYPHSMSEAEKVITGVAAEQNVEEDDREIKDKPIEDPATEPQLPQTPTHLLAPIIVVQQATPTTSSFSDYPTAPLAGTSTIRLVSQYLELPTKTGHGGRRKK